MDLQVPPHTGLRSEESPVRGQELFAKLSGDLSFLAAEPCLTLVAATCTSRLALSLEGLSVAVVSEWEPAGRVLAEDNLPRHSKPQGDPRAFSGLGAAGLDLLAFRFLGFSPSLFPFFLKFFLRQKHRRGKRLAPTHRTRLLLY